MAKQLGVGFGKGSRRPAEVAAAVDPQRATRNVRGLIGTFQASGQAGNQVAVGGEAQCNAANVGRELATAYSAAKRYSSEVTARRATTSGYDPGMPGVPGCGGYDSRASGVGFGGGKGS